MASLRYGTDNAPSAEWQAALDEQNRPNALRGGWETGRIGTDRNALGIDESAARAAGNTELADDLRRQNDALAQAQGRVAPRVGRVEDINGVGDALNWAAGQMGQGVASMVEPVAAATTIGGAGALLSLMPGPLGRVGKGLRNFGAPAAAYGINQRQLAGEFYNDAVQDPELMARTSAQDLNRTANAYGAVAGGLDTVAPAIIGRQLTGAGLRAGTRGMGPGLKTLLGATGEGATELAQNYGSQQTQGFLNPDRDTSGDFMENVNAAAGGFAGGGPLSAAGAYTDAAFRRTGAVGETIAARAGDVVDLAQETGGRAAEGARDLAGQAAARAGEIRDLAQEQYQGSALQGGVDRAVEAGKAGLAAGKQKTGDLIDLARGDDGQISLERLAEAAEQGVGRAKEAVGGAAEGVQDLAQRFKLSSKELEMLDMVPPPGIAEGPGYDAWANQASIERDSFVALRLQEMAETDPVAAKLFERAGNEQDPVAQFDIFEEAAEYLRQNSEITQVQAAANQYAENAGKVGAAVGRGALAAGKAAAGFGKALFDSAKAGARKQNLQSDAPASGFSAWRARTMPDAPAMQEQDVRRADMYGDILAAGVRANAKQAGIGEKQVGNMQEFLRDAGYRIANMAQSWKGEQGSKRPVATGQDMVLRELAGRMVSGLGRDADRALAEMQAIATPEAAPFFDRLRQSVVEGRTPQGRQKALSERNTVANELMLLLPEARRAEVMASEAKGGLLSRKWLLDSAEKLHNGHESPKFREAFEEAFGKDLVAQMMEHISPTAMKSAGAYGTAQDNATYATEDTLTEDGELVQQGDATGMRDADNDFEARQNEKMVRKGGSSKLYGFYQTKDQSVRSSDDRRDPFAPVDKMSKAQKERAELDLPEENARRAAAGLQPRTLTAVTRPNLYNSSEAGQRQLAEHVARMEKSAGPRYMVNARSALEVTKDLGYEPAKVLSIYRDYLRQDAAREGTPLAQRKYLREQANLADRAILDAMEGLGAEKNGAQMSPTQVRAAEATKKRIAAYQAKQAGKSEGSSARTSPDERDAIWAAAEKYLGEHSIAVAEMVTNRDPGQIEIGELVNFGRSGQRTWDFAMKGRSLDQGPDPQVMDDANIITFQSDVMGKTGSDRGLHIPAARLVGWVRSSRPSESSEEGDKSSSKAKDKNEAYLADLMEGITAIMDSGMVDAKLPTRMNAKGEWQAFAAPEKAQTKDREGVRRTQVKEKFGSINGVPKDLQLETMTYGNMEFGRKQRAPANAVAADEAREVLREERELEVREEQNKDWFVAEPLETLEPGPNGERQVKKTTQLVQRDLGTPADGRTGNGPIRTDRSGTTYADPKTHKENKTELDFFRKQKAGEVPDDYADQRYRSSVNKATDGIGPEPKMSAMKMAEGRGLELVGALNEDFAAGMERIESRMRTAGRPGYVAGDPNALVGGPHYIAPLAHALSSANIASFAGDERAYLDFKRAEVAGFILNSKLSVSQKVELTRAMAPKASRAKIVLGTYAGVLQKAAAAEKGQVLKVKPEPAPTPAPAPSQLQQTLDAHMEYLNNPPADYTTAKARAIADWAQRQLTRLDAAMAGVDETSERYETLSGTRLSARLLAKKAASVLEGDESLANVEGPASRVALELPGARATVAEGDYAALDAALAAISKGSGEGMSNADLDAATKWAATQAKAIKKQMASMEEGDHRDALETIYDDLVGSLGQLGIPRSEVAKRISAAPEVASAGLPKGSASQRGADWSDTGGRKLNAQASEIHNNLKRSGFAATHDSPIRHEGKFNWREHIGKGEGNAAFGAGTYLSTAEGVHENYKDQFSLHHSEGDPALEANHRKLLTSADAAMMKFGKKSPEYVAAEAARAAAELEYLGTVVRTTDASPTYQVSVDLKPEQLLNWDAPLSEQSGPVRKRLLGAMQDKGITADPWAENWGSFGAEVSDGTSITIMAEGDDNYVNHGGKIVGNFRTVELAKKAAEDRLKSLGLHTVTQNTGAEIYQGLTNKLGSQAKASDYLQSLGILGHRYAASGGKNDTHPNYVIYDDSKITTNYVHFSKQGGNARTVTDAEMKEAKDYVKKVLGPQVKVTFKDITGYAGEWIDAEQAMEISTTTAAGAMQTAYHEALHGFFSKFVKSDPRVLEVMKSLAGNEKIMARVQALLAKHPAALQQLSSGEERLAYIYQFWASGQLNLPIGQPRTLLQKVRKFFRAILGLVKDSERAAALLEAFHGGKLAEPSAAGRVIAKTLDEGTVPLKLRRSMDGIAQWTASRVMPSESILATSDSAAAKALGKEFFSNPGAGAKGQAAKGEGYLNARRHAASKYNNRRAALLKDLSENDMAAVMKHMQAETEVADIDFAPHREAVKGLRTLLQRFYRYMKDERGVEIDHAGEKYFPRVWNVSALVGQQQEFTDMLLQKYPAQMTEGARNGLTEADVAQRIWRNLVDRQGVSEAIAAQREDGVLSPFFASKETRTLSWLQGEHIEPFLEKNLVATLSQYFHQGARAAEYTSRFGKDGKDLERRLTQVNNELTEASFLRMKRGEFKDNKARAEWARRQFRDVSEAVGAMEGTLGKDVSPKLRKANSWMTVYQNVRLLPLSLFASFVDPMGMVARGAPMREAYDGFLRGMKEVFGTWGDMLREEPKERQADEWEQLAQHIGAVDAAVFSNFVADEYSSVYMEKGAKKINDTMFKLNGMEAWNRGMRVAGVKSAVKFIERHAANPEHHSARWIDELGLAMDKVPFDSTGKLITDKHVLMNEKGISKAQAERDIERVHTAINRWVEGAILTPNAAQRPAWSSDPHYSIFFHLKQFSYSFHQTIMKRAVKELNYGNLAPLGAFAWYIPVMIGADIVKGLIQGGGDLPNYMKGYDAGDWFWHGVNRSGTLGIGALGVGAFDDPGSILGPAPEQVLDAMTDPLAKTTLRALPGNSLYRQAFV